MSTHRTSSPRSRPGFTLVELLVVMGLILVLAAIGAAYIPGAMDAQNASVGAGQLQNWLQVARQRALLDRAPRGLRFIVDSTAGSPTNGAITSAVYIEQPDDFNPAGSTVVTDVTGGTPNPSQLDFASSSGTIDLYNGAGTDTTQWSVLPGDFILLQGTGMVHQILNVPSSTSITLVSPLTTTITTATSNYRVIRQARPIGEEPLLMPNPVGVDLNTDVSTTSGTAPYSFAGAGALPPVINGAIDIMFSPGGDVLNYNNTQNRIILWVRDYNYGSPFLGDPTLVVVYNRSGQVAAYSVDTTATTPPTPYSLVP